MEQIFCFSHAGGTASFYDALEKNLPDFEVVKLEYAGHGKRHKEPNYKSTSVKEVQKAQEAQEAMIF